MKKQIRAGVFESNSSSVHAITMCTETDYNKWIKGELIYDRWNENFVEVTPEMKKDEDYRYLTYDQFFDYDYIEFETFEDSYVPENGEKIIAFGYYGHD